MKKQKTRKQLARTVRRQGILSARQQRKIDKEVNRARKAVRFLMYT